MVMFKNIGLQTESAARVRLRWRNILLLFALALGMAGAGQTTPAQAAQPLAPGSLDSTGNFRLNVIYPPTICVGKNTIKVTPVIASEVNGHGNGSGGLPVGSVLITPEITDKSIATVSPPSQTSPVVPRRNEYIIEPGVGEVTFTLTGIKAGSTTLILTAKVPPRWAGGKTTYFGPGGMPAGGPIKVVNCKYRVIMTYDLQFGFLWWFGHMETEIGTTTGELYEGAGSFDFFGHVDIPGCTSTYDAFSIPVNITGRINSNDFLELDFNYGTASPHYSATCDYGSASGNGSVNPTAHGGILRALFEQQGQSVVYGTPDGAKVTITVQPLSK
jgi:hypothetical protein